MNHINLIKYSILALLVTVFGSLALASDGENAEKQSSEASLVASDPDYRVLRRMQTFRGPYSDQDDPLLKRSYKKEFIRTGVDQTKFVCRPPSCKREQDVLVVKLASTSKSQKMASFAGTTSLASDLFNTTNLTPVFGSELLERAEAKRLKGTSQAPQNSMGNPVDLTRWYRLALPAGTDLDLAIEELELDPRVEVVEANFERTLKGEPSKPEGAVLNSTSSSVMSDDPRKSDQWALTRTRTDEAWQWLDDNGYPAWGDRNIVVAVIDSGVDYTHEDLAGNMWVNAGEVPDDGIDNDGNGFVDDVYGADVVGSEYDHDGDPQDDNGHGTHVAGIIAAQGNNGIGIVGIAPNAQIMAIKAAQYSGALTSTDISEAILYAYYQGADIINMSFGGTGRSVLEEEALAVAYSNAVLIAAAGNSGAYNDLNCGRFASPSYPGAYSYVLGVMAESQYVAQNGDWLTGFSNWDCTAKNGLEYDVMAPGADILSTIPGDGYAAWDGTSMAAPIAAGMAALVRTRFNDKAVYSSRFIMGQLASTGSLKQGRTPPTPCGDCTPRYYASADALTSLTEVPEPSLAYLEHYLFDSTSQEGNDGDGIVDAGETIDLALVIKNYWGMADNVEVTLEAQARGAVAGPDPYVTWETPTVNYGGIGSFNQDDNGLIYDENQLITGVNLPFRFTVAADTPNEHILPLVVTMTATNGLDPSDTNLYQTVSRFNLIVQRGRELPRVIDSDAEGTDGGLIDTDGIEDGVVTIDSSTLWLIDNPVLVASGTTLKINPGVTLQFWGTQADDTYAVFENTYLQVEGVLDIEGTVDEPVTLKPSDLFPDRGVVIDNRGTVNVRYANLYNLSKQNYDVTGYENFLFDVIDHSLITRMAPDRLIAVKRRDDGYYTGQPTPTFGVRTISNSRIQRLGYEGPYATEVDNVTSQAYTAYLTNTENRDYWGDAITWLHMHSSLLDNSFLASRSPDHRFLPDLTGAVFLNNNQSWVNMSGDTVTQGSKGQLSSMSVQSRAIVAATMQFEGSTYALIHAMNPLQPDMSVAASEVRALALHDFAKSMEGSLAVYSSDAERDAIGAFLQEIHDRFRLELPESFLDLCANSLALCENIRDDAYGWPSRFFYGLFNDGERWGWITGEEPALEGYDPSSDTNIVTQSGRQLYASRLWNLPSSAESWASQVLIEIPSLLTDLDLQNALDQWGDNGNVAQNGNAILNQWLDPVPNHWMTIQTPNKYDDFDLFEDRVDMTNFYWGTQSEELVQMAVKSYQTDFNKMPAKLSPMLSEAPESAYPFVVDVSVKDESGNERPSSRFAAEPTVWDISFNRDMDISIQPLVTFGPDVPYTDFTVGGDWVDARTWRGNLEISPIATDGYQYIRVAGAVAADDPGLVTGDDKKRFRFEVITSGTESLNLQAVGGEGYVDLTWNQDDYDTLLGFNIYRSTSADSGFIRINQTLVGNEDRSYRDADVEPGVRYFYYFTVALDGSESEPSNTAAATPIDTVKPILSHNVVSTAPYGSTVLIQAEVTDNIGVQSVTLYYRGIGSTAYTSLEMINASGNTYRASIPASATQPPGVEYYIAATDGASYAYSGRSTNPNTISIDNDPVISAVTPSTGSSSGGDTITITGNNFADGASVKLGNATCQDVTVVSSSRITCVTPASAPELVAVTVENPDGGRGVLTSAYTFLGNSTSLVLPEFQAFSGETVDIPLSIDPVAGLQSFSAVISWDNTHLQIGTVVAGPLIAGWDFSYAMLDDNTVKVQGASRERVSGEGDLAIFEFLVLADGEASSILDIETAQLNEGTIAVSLFDGSFSVSSGFTLGGAVRYWDADQTPIVAEVTLNGQQEQTTAGDSGNYEFAGLGDQQHTLKVEKSDGNADALRAFDASLILSHALGTAPLAGSALASADVTGDGTVSEQDAAKVLEVAAGLAGLPFPNQASIWKFDPEQIRLDGLTENIGNANFTGLFMGDVSGNWGDTIAQSLEGLRLEVEDVSEDGVVLVNVFVGSSLNASAISAMELSFLMSERAALLSVERTEATSGWSVPLLRIEDNVGSLMMYDDISGAVVGETHALTLAFSVGDADQRLEGMSGFVNEKPVHVSGALRLKLADDGDGDLIRDGDDAFPDDPAASLDSDGDGAPDEWNPNASRESIEASDLVLDAFPDDPAEWLDTDFDGVGNNGDLDDDDDGMPDSFENEFGLDALDSSDSELDADSDGVNNLDEYLNNTDPSQDDYAPVLSAPADVDVISTGPLTVVDLGVATATDAKDGSVAVVADNEGPFKPGVTVVTWSATDKAGNKSADEQVVSITPLITLAAETQLVEGSSASVHVSLNGDAVVYPVSVELAVAGSAEGLDDHSLLNQTVILEQGTQVSLDFTTVDDGVGEGNESIELTLNNPVNASKGSPESLTIQLSEENIAPKIAMMLSQTSEQRPKVFSDEGLVTILADVSDLNIDDQHSFDWSLSDNRLVRDGSSAPHEFTFDPSLLGEGSYNVGVMVTDDGLTPLTTTLSMGVLVKAKAESLSASTDSDGDGFSDAEEGYTDSDGDRIPDYLDNSSEKALLPSGLNSPQLQTSGGASLRLGDIAVNAEVSGAEISPKHIERFAADVGVDGTDRYYFTRGIFDFEVYGVSAGSSAAVVIPQLAAIPPSAMYRKFNPTSGWQNFVYNDRNTVKSAKGELGVCPAPGSDVYVDGLREGSFCVELTLEDGGPNDADAQLNGVIKDPGGIATEEIPAPKLDAAVSETSNNAFEEGDGNSVVLAFSFVSDSNDAELQRLRFDAAGTLNDVDEIKGVRLYHDIDHDGQISDDDLLISEGLFAADDGTVDFMFDQPVALTRGETSFLVSYQF